MEGVPCTRLFCSLSFCHPSFCGLSFCSHLFVARLSDTLLFEACLFAAHPDATCLATTRSTRLPVDRLSATRLFGAHLSATIPYRLSANCLFLARLFLVCLFCHQSFCSHRSFCSLSFCHPPVFLQGVCVGQTQLNPSLNKSMSAHGLEVWYFPDFSSGWIKLR